MAHISSRIRADELGILTGIKEHVSSEVFVNGMI